MSYTEKKIQVKLGPYDVDTGEHTIFHPETDGDVVELKDTDFSDDVKKYLSEHDEEIPKNLTELVKILKPSAFGENNGGSGTTDCCKDHKHITTELGIDTPNTDTGSLWFQVSAEDLEKQDDEE